MGIPASDDRSSIDEQFLAAVEGAAPLTDRDRLCAPAGTRKLVASSAKREFARDEDGSGRAAGVSRKTLKRLFRGEPEASAELDLHGLRLEAAQTRVATFLASSRKDGHRAVRIITGKADRFADDGDRLRAVVPDWLSAKLSTHVLGFCVAPSHMGGAGALLVLLRSS